MKPWVLISFLSQLLFSNIVQGVEVRPLADCTVKVFTDIGRNSGWSGKAPAGCPGTIRVEQRAAGVFVTMWIGDSSGNGWDRISFSAAVGLGEIGNKKLLKKAGRDIKARAARLERCLDSILRVNDPLECRDRATRSYSAGDVSGFESERTIWLDDNGRHSVVEYANGDTKAVVTAPADLFGGTALPPGTKLNIHVVDSP